MKRDKKMTIQEKQLNDAIAAAKAEADWLLVEWLRTARGSEDASRWYTSRLKEKEEEIKKLRKELKSLKKEFLYIGECKNVGKGWLWRCSECNCRLDIDRDFLPTMWVDGIASTPKFCPNCGKKVVNDE